MAAGDLTTLASVRTFLQKETGDTGQDSELSTLITAASTLINTHVAYFTAEAATAKTFVWRGGPLSLHPYFLRTASSVVMDPDETTSTTLSTSDYRLRPKPPRLGAYRWLTLPGQTLTPGYEREITITGDWGLSSIPADVAHWTNVAVAIWLRRDVSAFSTTLRLEEDRLERPDKLPTAVSAGLARYADPRPI